MAARLGSQSPGRGRFDRAWRRQRLEPPGSGGGRRIESAFDLDDVVLVEPVDLDDGARRIGPVTPQLLLDLVDQRAMAVHVRHIDDEPHRIGQLGAAALGDQLHVHEGLTHARFCARRELVACGVDAAHARDIDVVSGPGSEAPGRRRLDGAGRLQNFDGTRGLCARCARLLQPAELFACQQS